MTPDAFLDSFTDSIYCDLDVRPKTAKALIKLSERIPDNIVNDLPRIVVQDRGARLRYAALLRPAWNVRASAVFACPRFAAAPYLDPRLPSPAVNTAFVPKRCTTLLRGAVWRVLGLRYPEMPAYVAYGDPHSRPAHAGIIQHSVLRTQYH
jgi:hypothetical protein